MIKNFMDENFLLNNEVAVELYNNYVKDMPIFDYHSHINTGEIAENKRFKNLAELWLSEDHYKWRAMRSNGIEEKYITGNADDYEKFSKWAETIQKCIGNPLYHWVHLELKRYFGIEKLLSPDTAKDIWETCNTMLQKEDFSAKGLLKKSKLKVICSTDDPTDSLNSHLKIRKDNSFDVKVLPTFRADNAIYVERDEFKDWVEKLGESARIKINNFDDFKNALIKRIEFFNDAGCRMSDHSLEIALKFRESTEKEAADAFEKAIKRIDLREDEILAYKTQIMVFLGRHYSRLFWTMQLHIGPIRNNNKRMFEHIGPDRGFDAISDYPVAENLAFFLNKLDYTDELPKTIIYNLNPGNNEIISSMCGCFQSEIPLKIQPGSAWWFNDQKDGITKQIISFANTGILSRVIGFTTDSRSFTSFTRHEYYRRILCNIVGQWVCDGEVPNDMEMLGNMMKDICYNNAQKYFKL